MEICKHVVYALSLVFSLLHVVHAFNQSGFISLDCGLPKTTSHTEPTVKMDYISDVPYISSGVSKSIKPEYKANQQKQVPFVRSFPQKTRNSYKLNVTKATKYLIRATFLYGNYDSQNKLPQFDLHLGPNYWVTVNISSVSLSIVKEVIHITLHSQNHLQICVVNTNAGIPFISTLELRPLRNTTYVTTTGSLALHWRFDFGSTTNQSYRYPYDIHDRLCKPYTQKDWTALTTSLTINDINGLQAPSIMMNTSVTPLNASGPLEFYWESPDESTQYYVYLHFAEIQLLQSNQSRAYNIYLNGDKWYEAGVPEYLKSSTIISMMAMSISNYSFSLVRLKNSTLPPILNALEVYMVIDFS